MSLARSQDARSIQRSWLYFYILSTNAWKLKLKCTIYSSLKNMIYLEINLAKYAKDWFTENCKTMLKKNLKKTWINGVISYAHGSED